MAVELRVGNALELIKDLPDNLIDCVTTSPPYWGLRDYKTEPIIFDGLPDCEHEWGAAAKGGDIRFRGANSTVGNHKNQEVASGDSECNFCVKCGAWRGQLGLEPTPELFIQHLLDFFDDVKLKLKDEGNVFVNLGDTYAGSGCGTNDYRTEKSKSINGIGKNASLYKTGGIAQKIKSIPSKSLCMIPQRFAWGMIERGWILRNEIIWAKPNHMPESVTDRLTKAHEVIYHFVKQGKYYYNLDAIREPHIWAKKDTRSIDGKKHRSNGKCSTKQYAIDGVSYNLYGKNPGDVWEITTQPYPESHFAVFPLELVRRPILAGCPVGGTVLDPFVGSGTVGEFCRHNDRNAILFELNPDYKRLIEDRAMLKVPELSKWFTNKIEGAK